MGIEPYLITSTVLGFMAQRLVRVICTQCKETYKPTTSELESIGISKKFLRTVTYIVVKVVLIVWELVLKVESEFMNFYL